MPQEKRAEAEAKPSEKVVGLARQIGFQGFGESFFSELEGNELMKKALTCALFSTPEEPMHVLVIGDPAGGKTLARDIIARKLGTGIELVGANATRAGLVCNLATGEPGVLTHADGKVVLVDEFDKIPDQDIEYCYELLSNGKCSIHSARVHETIESHFIMVTFANPVGTIFLKEPIQEIGLPPILLSRFALIVKVEELEADQRKKLLKRKLLGQEATSHLSQWHLPWLRESRKHCPRFVASESEIDAYVERIDGLIEQHQRTPLRRDSRMGDYARRIPAAIARASFSDMDSKILEEAAELMEDCVATWQS
jgi:DNA replicative helicase MCM subunit Mcm2 (Cdc46/Mcm family)